MNEWHVVSFSGGKDSTAMLLRMLELNMRVDEIIFCDTGVEFPQMYEHVDKVEKYIGRQVTKLKAEHDFEYLMLHHKVARKNGREDLGYSWPGPRQRWCTSKLKQDLIRRHFKGKEGVVHYIGIAADEAHRAKGERYPLIEWGWTEAMALNYCYQKGFDFGGLYKIFHRVSCWCCPLQSLEECRKLRKHFPQLWERLREMDRQTWRTFKAGYSVDQLEERFAREDDWEQMQMNLF